jgi:hypothetical protein
MRVRGKQSPDEAAILQIMLRGGVNRPDKNSYLAPFSTQTRDLKYPASSGLNHVTMVPLVELLYEWKLYRINR